MPDLGHVHGEDEEDTAFLRGMARKAVNYLHGFEWFTHVSRIELGFGVGGVVAVFGVFIGPPLTSGDTSLWVVVGDLPSAYLVTDELPSPREALEAYGEMMESWAVAVTENGDLAEEFPVAAAPTCENARMLRARIGFLRDDIIPAME